MDIKIAVGDIVYLTYKTAAVLAKVVGKLNVDTFAVAFWVGGNQYRGTYPESKLILAFKDVELNASLTTKEEGRSNEN